MTEQLKSVARSWATDGFDTLLPAMFDRVERGCVVAFDNLAEAQRMAQQFDREKVELDIRAAVATVERGRGVSLIGFCWGGGTAARMASTLDLRGIVSYYGTKLAENTESGAHCATLFHFGASDPHSPPEIIETVKRNLPQAEYYLYEAGHAFANDARPDFYHGPSAELARERSLEFLRRVHRN